MSQKHSNFKPERIFDIFGFFSREKGDQPAFFHRKQGQWQPVTGEAYAHEANRISCFFLEQGIQKGEAVVTLLENRPEWNFLDYGILQTGGVHVPLAPTVKPAELAHILNQLNPRWLIASGKHVLHPHRAVLAGRSHLQVYTIDPAPDYSCLNEVLPDNLSESQGETIRQVARTIKSDDTGIIFYSSGTTGNPKGIKYHHQAWIDVIENTLGLMPYIINNRTLSLLPLAYGFERFANHIAQRGLSAIYYASRELPLLDNIGETGAGFLASVPVFLENIYDEFLAKHQKDRERQSEIRQILQFAEKSGQLDHKNIDSAVKSVPGKEVLKRFKSHITENALTVLCSGARLRGDVLKFYWFSGIPVYEMYGTSETMLISLNAPQSFRLGSVGKPIHPEHVKIADDGEIVVKIHTQGYVDPEDWDERRLTRDMWYYTGDVGYIDQDGFLYILGRKSDVFKTAEGLFVKPAPMEEYLKRSPFIRNALVVGEFKPFISVLIVPDFAVLKKWAEEKGIQVGDVQELLRHDKVQELYSDIIADCNDHVGDRNMIEKFILLTEEWTVDNGLMTSTLKPKRKAILQRYSREIDLLYS